VQGSVTGPIDLIHLHSLIHYDSSPEHRATQDSRARLAEVEVKVEVERRPDVLRLSLGLSLNLLMTVADFFNILLGPK
jgi:hypothetical protein